MSKQTKIRLRTGLSIFTSAITALSMSGVMYLAPVASAAAILDGDLIRATGTNDIYIVKLVGAKSFKRLILNPDIFNSYGHLQWSSVQDVPQSTVDAYTTSTLVIEVNADGSVFDPKVYSVTSAANSDIGQKQWVNMTPAQFEAAGYDWDSIAKINHTEAAPAFYPAGADITSGTVTAPTAGLSVVAAGTDPASKVAAMGSQDVVFTTVNFTAGTSAAVKVNSLTVERGQIGDGGISADSDFTNVKLYRGSVAQANQMGGTLVLNTTTHSSTFTNLNWTINAGTSDKLIVTGSLKATSITGNVMMLGLRAASAVVVADTTQTVSGTFPVFGTKVSPATTAVGSATIQMLTTPGAANLISGSTAQPLATLRFAPSTEDFKLLSVKFTNAGSGLPTDVSNLQLMYGSVVLSTVAAMNSNNTITMNITAPANENLVKTGTTRDFTVYGDLASTINTSRTIIMEVMQAADVSAQGVTSGGLVTVTAAASNDCGATPAQTFPNVGCTQTITQGSLSTAISPAYNPSASTVVLGASKRIATALRFSASNNEAVNVTQVTITDSGNDADTDVASIYLAKVAADGTAGDVLATGSLSSGTVQFGTNTINAADSSYLFQVPKGGNYDVYVLVDVPTSATNNKTIIMSVASAAHVKADGVSSMNDIPAASITGTATGNALTTSTSGNVTVSKSSTTAATTYVKGAKDKEFARFTFTADSGENATLSALKLTFTSDGAGTALSTANTPTNVRVYKETVDAANLLGTVSSPASGIANFSFTDTLVANTSRVYIVVGDIPTTNAATSIYAEIKLASTDTTITGVSSGTTISPGAIEYAGNAMTIAVGQLGVIMSSLPVYTSITAKTNGAEVARIVLTSNANGETIRVSNLKVTLAGAANTAQNLSIDAAAISNITLYDVNGGDIAGTGIKTKVIGTLTSNAANFTGLQIDIPSGSQKVIGVKVNVGSPTPAAPTNIVMGIANYYTDVAASGMDSLSTVYANQLVKSGVLATLFAASAIDDTDLTGNITDANDELSEYSVPALGITAVGVGDVIEIESEDIIVTTASNGTVVRNGFGGTTAAAHSTTGVPILLKISMSSISTTAFDASSSNWSVNSNTALTAANSLAAGVHAGQLVAQEDTSVAAASDDLKLVTAITATGLTLTLADAYGGAVFTEDTGNDQWLVTMTNYGRAQIVQSVGSLTLAVSSGTPIAKQVVAGTSDVEFTRLNLTSLYEKINVTMLKVTRTGDSGTADHLGGGSDTDFASVYLQNLTDPTWGPNNNGKSNTVQLNAGKATFNFSAADAIVVDPNNSNGVEIAVKGNLNTTTAGVSSGDAPKFYISTLGDVTQVTANGVSTGTTLTALTAGTPTPATATNVYAQSIYKGLLSVALNSASLSGNQTRSGNQTFLQLDMASASTGSTATFRAALQNEADANTLWTAADDNATLDNSTPAATTTVYVESTGAIWADPSNGDALQLLTYNIADDTDLSGYSRVSFWVRSDNAEAAGDLDFAISEVDNVTTTNTESIDVPAISANTWTFVDLALSTTGTNRDSVNSYGLKSVGDAMTADGLLYIDDIRFYNDKIKVSLSSNAGLFATTASINTASVNLQQGSTVLATGYYDGTTSAGSVTFIPTTQFTVPTTTTTYGVVADTTVLMTGAKTLASTVSLGSADNGGSTTAGNIFWYDGSFSLVNKAIQWVYGTVTSISSGTISYQ